MCAYVTYMWLCKKSLKVAYEADGRGYCGNRSFGTWSRPTLSFTYKV